MTTIAFCNGYMSADTLITGQGSRAGYVSKLYCRPDTGIMIGCAGTLSDLAVLIDWANNITPNSLQIFQSMNPIPRTLGCFSPQLPRSIYAPTDSPPEALIYLKGMGIYYWGGEAAIAIAGPFFAVGSGADFAMAAMACGKSAPEAVSIASMFDIYTAGEIQTMTIPEPVAEASPAPGNDQPAPNQEEEKPSSKFPPKPKRMLQ